MSKIWSKSDSTETHEIIEKYTVWKDYILDIELLKYDIQASKAHAKMLLSIWLISDIEKETLLKWLEEIDLKRSKWEFKIDISQEDGHTAIESYLVKNYGEVGKKIHTWRSRNDQILVTLRLYTLDKYKEISALLETMITSLENKIQEVGEIKMPWYTHTQRAMPTTVWVWLWSFKEALLDNKVLLNAARDVNNQNPLWSAAGFWDTWLWLDRQFTTDELGFNKTQSNPMHCGYSRWKFEYIMLQSLSHIMLDLWKLANDLVFFSSKEFNFFNLPDSFKTWSSIMPQKKNWDIMELVRGNANIFLWYEFQVREVYKMLLSWYNRDYQLTKEPYLNGVNLVINTISVCNLVINNLWVKKHNIEKACSEELYATKEAYQLVKEGMNFRDAYIKIWQKYK